MKEFTILSEGKKLSATLHLPDHPKNKNPAILFIHGHTSNQTRNFVYTKPHTNLGAIVLTFDMSGHGKSEGDIDDLSRKRALQNALDAYDYLAAQPKVDSENIYIEGSSYGGYIASILTSKRKAKALVLRVPANYPDDGFEKPNSVIFSRPELTRWRSEKKDFSECMSLCAIHDYKGDLLLVESGKDDIIPHQTLQNYADAVKDKSKLTHIVLSDAVHDIIPHPRMVEETRNIFLKWFVERIT